MTITLIAQALEIDPANFDMDAILRDAEITFEVRGRHAVIDDDELDLLWEMADSHRSANAGADLPVPAFAGDAEQTHIPPKETGTLMNDHQIITDLIGHAAQLSADDSRAWRWATEALALASAVELALLIEEAEGLLERMTHDVSCAWCNGVPGAPIPVASFWCTH